MNKLANSTSPYLLQHANNPVHWFPWGLEALQKAKSEDKLILVSIGYSACHWCHVMEHESFEDEAVAAVMNEHFICIKVDREERPDIDQIYMSAVQLMSGRGGWPLNCICLPDQRPIYGGTYFRKNDWTSLLFNLADFYKQKPLEAKDYAKRLTEGINQFESIVPVKEVVEFNHKNISTIVENWKKYFDNKEGGLGNAPKFPMPNNWIALMRYAYLAKDKFISEMLNLTLQKMAFGGIYDHVGGGFARYSVDGRWHVPHFEKMLYDNAQLVSLYSEAFTNKQNQLYINVVQESINFILNNLTSPEFGFYSALDADSEGVEGKFYIFTKKEIELILGNEADLFCIYYNITEDGNWEEEHSNVLFRKETDEKLCELLSINKSELIQKINNAKSKVFKTRENRIRPGLDNKILASWNGLMLKGLCDAYKSIGNPDYLEYALKNAKFIIDNLITRNGRIKRVYDKYNNKNELISNTKPIAFLDDYANVIDAMISLYEITLDEEWLKIADNLVKITFDHYFNNDLLIFHFTANDDEQLIARKSEIMDGVIPSSNSVMANNLKKLGLLFQNQHYLDTSAQMLKNIYPELSKYPSSYSNWIILLLSEIYGTYEVAITGNNAENLRKEFEKNYIPNKIILGGTKGILPLLENKFSDKTQIFICKDKTCGLPSFSVQEAIEQINA